jgi:nucleoside-diphosphate-sugar epimerase
VQHDITQPLPTAIGDFEYVIHAASIASPMFYRLHPIETMDANVIGLRLLLERARTQQDRGTAPAGFLYFSTSEIYGDPEPSAIPTPETYPGRVSSTGPRACYDESKRYGETLCANFARQYGLPITMARPFNNYGPGLRITDGRVIPDLARDLFAGADLVLHSDGSPTRTFCYVADAVVGYYKVLVRGTPGEAYNIGREDPEVTIEELARRMAALGAEMFGYSGRVVRKASDDPEYLTDNPRRRCPDISKARRDVGFAPEIPLNEGLRRALLWYADNNERQGN